MKQKRSRPLYGVITILVIILGIASRKFSIYLPQFINLYLGDALWAFMIFSGFGFLFTNLETKKLGLAALMFCYFIEVTQLYHSSWIDSIRRTTLGGLVLGYGFLWSDLIAYTMGISIGVLLEVFAKKILRCIKNSYIGIKGEER